MKKMRAALDDRTIEGICKDLRGVTFKGRGP